MGLGRGDAGQARVPGSVAQPQLRAQMRELVLQLPLRDRNAPPRSPAQQPRLVERVPALPRLARDRGQVRCDRRERIAALPKALQLRVARVSARAAREHGLREEALAPQHDEPRRIEISRVERPETHSRYRTGMRLVLAAVIAAAVFGALVALATSYNVPRDLAAAFAAPVFATVPLLHRASRGRPNLFVYAFFTSLAALALAEALAIVVEYVISEHPTLGILALIPPSLAVSVPLLFLAGAWMGAQRSRHGALLPAAVVVALVIVRCVYDLYVVPPSAFELAPRTIGSLALGMGLQLLVWGVPLALGFGWAMRATARGDGGRAAPGI